MNFNDIIGQEDIKRQLVEQFDRGRLPHALMLCGPEGTGKLGIALALARYMHCEHPVDGQPCEQCHACRMTAQWQHPDLHFSFPLIKVNSNDDPVSDDRLAEWREQISRTIYFTQADWLNDLRAENQQLQYYVRESDALQHKLSIKSSQGGYRVVIVWLPEKMRPDTANKLLKLIEEPPQKTHFLMVCQEPDQVLGTILSRMQRIQVPVLSEELIAQALMERHAADGETAKALAHVAQGSYTAAVQLMAEGGDIEDYFQSFMQLMRLCYKRDVKELRQWSEDVAKLGRERQKHMLEYYQHIIRENFVYNFQHPELNYMTPTEESFAKKFSPFINERNIIPITEHLAACQNSLAQNGNAKIVFFDLAVKLIILLRA